MSTALARSAGSTVRFAKGQLRLALLFKARSLNSTLTEGAGGELTAAACAPPVALEVPARGEPDVGKGAHDATSPPARGKAAGWYRHIPLGDRRMWEMRSGDFCLQPPRLRLPPQMAQGRAPNGSAVRPGNKRCPAWTPRRGTAQASQCTSQCIGWNECEIDWVSASTRRYPLAWPLRETPIADVAVTRRAS